MNITPQQKETLRTYLKAFLDLGRVEDKNGSVSYQQFDANRVAGAKAINKSVLDFIKGEMSLADFRDVTNKLALEHNHWGFTGLSGQMQLNLYKNRFENSEEAVNMLREAITLPKDLNEAKAKIEKVGEFLRKERASADNVRFVPWDKQAFLLSYFWEMQEPEKFPVYYKSSRDTLSAIGFDLETYETHAEEYLAFVEITELAVDVLKTISKSEQHPIWFVEHALWWERWQGSQKEEPVKSTSGKGSDRKSAKKTQNTPQVFSSAWLPPIIADLPDLARNKETEWSKTKGVRPEKAFETKLRFLFTILGYEVTELGQGTGRQPDGIAVSAQAQDGYYAIVYDAKAREGEYNIGTDDRSIIDYIQRKKRELERARVSKMYFLLISSEFSEAQANIEKIRAIYRSTQVPVILLRADDLLFLTEEKLKSVQIDHTLLEDLFLEFGLLTREKIVSVIGA